MTWKIEAGEFEGGSCSNGEKMSDLDIQALSEKLHGKGWKPSPLMQFAIDFRKEQDAKRKGSTQPA
jgi:hypothetical protein